MEDRAGYLFGRIVALCVILFSSLLSLADVQRQSPISPGEPLSQDIVQNDRVAHVMIPTNVGLIQATIDVRRISMRGMKGRGRFRFDLVLAPESFKSDYPILDEAIRVHVLEVHKGSLNYASTDRLETYWSVQDDPQHKSEGKNPGKRDIDAREKLEQEGQGLNPAAERAVESHGYVHLRPQDALAGLNYPPLGYPQQRMALWGGNERKRSYNQVPYQIVASPTGGSFIRMRFKTSLKALGWGALPHPFIEVSGPIIVDVRAEL